jgi:hypothetical protein
MNRIALLALLAPLTLLSACGEREEDEGPLMAPGQDCTRCHDFTAAGTVYATAGATQGEPGVTVLLDGRVSLTTNAAGNFYTRASLPASYAVQLTKGSLVQSMSGATRGCNGCHGVSRSRIFLQ